jgi:DNA-binding MarR family transcriptional regulator
MPPDRDLFLFRLHRLASVAGQPLIRLCEGRYSITRREWRLILVLAQNGPLLSSALARRAGLVPARASRAVTLLVERGLATRVPRANDRRYVEIHLTEQARGIYDALYPVVVDIDAQLLAGLTEAEQAEFDRLLKLLESAAPTLMTTAELPKANRRRAQ